jgi:hypothetical protein
MPNKLPFEKAMQADDLQRLLTLKMPYGKYEGRYIADLPGHYLGWFAREGFPKGEIGRLLELMYEIDHNNLRELLNPLRQSTK